SKQNGNPYDGTSVIPQSGCSDERCPMRRIGIPVAMALVLLVAACSGGSSTGAAPGGGGNPGLWMGYTPPPPPGQGPEYESLKGIVAAFTRLHPKIHIQMEYVNNDDALQKVTVALQGGEQPDISYQYGTNMPQVSQASAIVNLSQTVQQPGFGWSDF